MNCNTNKGLYLVTPDSDDTAMLCHTVESALHGGVVMVQYRHKLATPALRKEQASALLAICRKANVPFLINDHLELVMALDADGIHVGQHDDAVMQVRHMMGKEKIIGASCYNQLQLAHQAQKDGADYVAFGACYPSSTKPNAPRATADLFTTAKKSLSIPLVAIGGITLANANDMLAAGADMLAVITDIFHAGDIQSHCLKYKALFA